MEAAAGSDGAAPNAPGEAASGSGARADAEANDLFGDVGSCGATRSGDETAAGQPSPATSAQEGDLSTFGVRLGPPGAVLPSPADPDPDFGIPASAIADVAGGSAEPSDADPPLAGAAADSRGPDEPEPVARAADAPDRLRRAMRGRIGLGLGCALDEPAPGGCTFRKYNHTTKGWCWEGKLPKGKLFNGKNSCTRGFPGPRTEEVAKMEVAMFLESWWATTNSD